MAFGVAITVAVYLLLTYASGRTIDDDNKLWGTTSIEEFGGLVYVTWVLILQVGTLALMQRAERLHQWIALAGTSLVIVGILIYTTRWDDFATPAAIVAAICAASANALTIFLSPAP